MEVTALKSRAWKELTMSTTKLLTMLTMAILIAACGSTAALAQRGGTSQAIRVHDHRGEKLSSTSTTGRVPPSRRPPSRQAGVPTAPGSYAVSTKWQHNGVQYVRVAAYSLRSNGTVRSDYWDWSSKDSYQYSKVVIVGSASPKKNDARKWVQSEASFLGDESKMKTEYGRYNLFNEGKQIRIIWNDGTREYWKRTWHDSRLNKIELYYTSRASVVRNTNLYMNPSTKAFSRRPGAENAGYGFGSPYGFKNTGLPISKFNANYKGQFTRWNGYFASPSDNEGTKSWAMNHKSLFSLTTNNVWRHFEPKGPKGRPVFYYTARPQRNPGLTSRRVVVQISHDWDGDDHIEDNFGHMYFGLEVIDHAGNPRGFVFADATWDLPTDSMKIMSAMFAIDRHSAAAQTGIE